MDFAQFAEDREPLLREFLRLENGLPSHDTFSRVFRLLDPAAFGRAFDAFLVDLGTDGAGVLAIDGKTLRRSFDRAAGRSPLHVVTAFGVISNKGTKRDIELRDGQRLTRRPDRVAGWQAERVAQFLVREVVLAEEIDVGHEIIEWLAIAVMSTCLWPESRRVASLFSR